MKIYKITGDCGYKRLQLSVRIVFYRSRCYEKSVAIANIRHLVTSTYGIVHHI